MIMVLCFLFIFFKSNFLQFSPDGPANAVQPKTLVARGVIVPGGCGGGGGGQGVEELFLYHCPLGTVYQCTHSRSRCPTFRYTFV